MIQHIWSVICSDALIDRDNNTISLLKVLEQVNITAPPPTPIAPGYLPVPMQIATLWERLPIDQPVRGTTRLIVRTPSGNTLGTFESDIDLTEFQRMRTIMRVPGIPLPEAGRYEFRIDLRDGADDWRQVAILPIQFNFQPLEGPVQVA